MLNECECCSKKHVFFFDKNIKLTKIFLDTDLNLSVHFQLSPSNMDLSWSTLKASVHPNILKTIEVFGFKTMTPVQAACIPAMLGYKDVAAEAVTGSGKTLAFLVPTLQILLRRDSKWKKTEVGAVIIAPTRELAIQISEVLEQFLKTLPQLSYALFIGGTSVDDDLDSFNSRGGNIIIATPGRLEDLLLHREASNLPSALKYLEVLILDEADCLLSLGFEKALNGILQMLPKQRRTGLFSATQTTEVLKLIRAGLRNPVSVVVRDKNQRTRVPASLENFYWILEPELKFHALVSFIKNHSKEKILVFFATCACVDYFSLLLKKLTKQQNISAIHGKMKEKARVAVFEKFRQSQTGVLCCTDVMARGIDITKKIHWVIQFDPPSHPASFIHRSGRTARCGEEGRAILFLQPSEQEYVKFLEINQKVELFPINFKANLSSNVTTKLHNDIQQLQLQDRTLFDKATRAFVSYFKAYQKYEVKLILNIKDLNFGKLGYMFGLLKFPKISELRGKIPEDFEEYDIDVNEIKYKDKLKEESRKRKLETFIETGKWPGVKKKVKRLNESTPWSKIKDKKAKRQEKKAVIAQKKTGKGKMLSESEVKLLEKAFGS